VDPEDAPRPPEGWIGEAVQVPPASASRREATTTLDGVVAYPQGATVHVTTVLSNATLRRVTPSGVPLTDLRAFGFDGAGTSGRATLTLVLADGLRCPEIPYPASVDYAGAAPGVFWRGGRGDGAARNTWEWWISPLPPASFEVHVAWDEADVPPLRASIDGAAVHRAAGRARAVAPPFKRPQDLTVDDVPLARVSTNGPPSEAAWAEVVAFAHTLDLSEADGSEDAPYHGMCHMLRAFVVAKGPPTLNDAALADVIIDGLYKVVSRGRPRPYPPG
jgi:hypothetical protein